MRFIKWILSLFIRHKNFTINKNYESVYITPINTMYLTSGKNHVWVKRFHGWVRKPKGCENERGR